MNNFINTIMGVVVCMFFIGYFPIKIFRYYFLRVPCFIVIGIVFVGYLLGLFKISGFGMVEPIAIFYLVLLNLVEFGIEDKDNIKSFYNLKDKDRRRDNPNIKIKNIAKSQWDKNILFFTTLFSVEQIIAYTENLPFYKYDGSNSNSSTMIQSSSLVIPLAITLIYYFCVKLFNKIKTKIN